MPYKITNTSDLALKGQKVPLTIHFKDGVGDVVKKVIEHGESIIMEFIPVSAQQMHVRNAVSIEFIPKNR